MKEVQILKAIENGVVRDFKNNNKISENLEIYQINELVRLVSLAGFEPQTLCLQSRSTDHYTIQESTPEWCSGQ